MSTKVGKIFDFWAVAEKLKTIKRWKGTAQMKEKESTADHSWQVAALIFVTIKELGIKIDQLKSLKLALVHDLAEAITDDIDCVLIHTGKADRAKKDQDEENAILNISKILPGKSGREIKGLWFEYKERKTPEARFVYAMDKLEAISHLIFVGHKNFHDHGDFLATYRHEAVANFPALRPLHFFLQQKLKVEYGKHGWDWKEKYNVPAVSKKLLIPAERIFKFVEIGEQFKKTIRYSSAKRLQESSAEHSWNLALASFIVAEELNLNIDALKSIQLSLFHDLPEAITGDIDYSFIYFGQKTKKDKHEGELVAIEKIKEIIGGETGWEIFNIWNEYENAETKEAKFIKALDKIEGINHVLCLGYKCFDHPELIAPYPNNATKNYPPIIPLLNELHSRLKPEFVKCNWEWKEEYNI